MAEKGKPIAGRRHPENQRAVVERRRSSAATPHDPRPKRERTREASKRRALDEQ